MHTTIFSQLTYLESVRLAVVAVYMQLVYIGTYSIFISTECS